MNDIVPAFQEMVSRLAGDTIAEKVNSLEKEMLKYEQVPCPVFHHFSPGLYTREVNMPAGTLAIGHRQTAEHLNIFLKGRIVMLNENGSTSEITAPMIFTGNPIRKIGYVLEDVVWLNVYPTEERDINKLEAMYAEKSDAWLDAKDNGLPKLIDKEDYGRFLAEIGYTEEMARKEVEREEDIIPFPNGSYSVKLGDSKREGLGLFATAPFKPGDMIAPARVDGKRPPAGRYINHSKRPNAEARIIGGDIYVFAKKEIGGCCGGFDGEEITMNYRDNLRVLRDLYNRREICETNASVQ
jgi:hypothetical protein